MSSPFFVVQAQRDLSLARTVEIQAISDYNKSLVDFEAVQQVPINGGGNFVQVARAARRTRKNRRDAKPAEKAFVLCDLCALGGFFSL